ncbi:DUF2927 domain-containing protein [Wenxinia marina]|uniref:DUF2927 domain-containing protein n=1 Tax=Wenxinia marina DSM 24838 TaxID=1123501 RepID=A0A0D0P8P9_9RHOB|nr:DUF2927 domain-containing protein [Wenxinia marina]KIQ67946.1 hypothetical protein Wenmar_03401 [Wenxinia marina DSM 24838]GGL76013.1 hypothetical protein GCM10011392_33230 [Wenxinia marina]
MRATLAAALVALAAPAAAQDYIVTQGRLTDEEFYRLVACGAAPGGECRMPYVRWPRGRASALSVGIDRAPAGYPRALAENVSDALDRAIDEINGIGSALQLSRAPGKAADVVIRLIEVGDGEAVSGSGVPELEGEPMGAAYVYVWWNGRMEITEARILMADDLPHYEVYPVLLEELTQAMGFLNDIRNPLYDSESVFSEDSNAVMTLGQQDRAALLRHYPALR